MYCLPLGEVSHLEQGKEKNNWHQENVTEKMHNAS